MKIELNGMIFHLSKMRMIHTNPRTNLPTIFLLKDIHGLLNIQTNNPSHPYLSVPKQVQIMYETYKMRTDNSG